MSTLMPRPGLSNLPTNDGMRKKLHFGERGDITTKEESSFRKGQKVYVRDGTSLWTSATVVDVLTGHLVVNTGTKQDHVSRFSDVVVQPTNERLEDVIDLTSISPLSAPAVLDCLCRRYQRRTAIYTWAGQTLVALNPFTEQHTLYGTTAISSHHQQRTEDHDVKGLPHVYSVAARAFSNMRCGAFQPNQSIVVSGESGAGKTVSARHLMKYLVTVANRSPIGQKETRREDSFGCEIERRILSSNPILEAFGNAGTLRNANSSRFGKYIELQFDRFGHVSGATIQTYLLEKTRAVRQAPGEHTFHIFYQMLAGLEQDARDRLGLDAVHLDVGDRLEADDLTRWHATQEALAGLQLSRHLQDNLLRVLSAVLLLTRITISKDEEDEDLSSIDTYRDNLTVAEKAASLLQVDLGALEAALTHRRITASHARRKSVFVKPCAAHEAEARRDCLAKLLYARLFERLVTLINRRIHTHDVHSTIGLLDIYGFESFATNSLEQLCINYANERLQQHYVTHFLRELQAEYKEEALPFSGVDFVDNRPCLELLEGGQVIAVGSPGLFSLINEECQVNRPGGDQGLSDRLLHALGGPQPASLKGGGPSPPGRLGTPRERNLSQPAFVVNHYAAPVTYSVRGLLEKNKDNIPPELVELLQRSTNEFIVDLFDGFETDHPGKKKKTVLAKFKTSLDDLMRALNATEPHYIRCIKPNTSCSPGQPDRTYIYEQLAAAGIVETVQLNRNGYPTRIPYERFLQRYSILLRSLPDEGVTSGDELSADTNKENELVFDPLEQLYHRQLRLTPRRSSMTPKRRLRRRAVMDDGKGISSCDHTRKLTASILWLTFKDEFIHTPASLCQFGISKLFLKDGKLEQLEAFRLRVISGYVFTLQCAWRRYQRHKKRTREQAATVLQSVWRAYLARQQFKLQLDAVCTIQRAARSWCTRRRAERAADSCSPITESADNQSEDRISPPVEFYTPRGGVIENHGQSREDCFFTPHAGLDDTLTTADLQATSSWEAAWDDTPNKSISRTGGDGRNSVEDGLLLYNSSSSTQGQLSPLTVPTLGRLAPQTPRIPPGTIDEAEDAYIVVQEDLPDEGGLRGGQIYHIVRSPRPGAVREGASQVLRRVATSISATTLSRWKFQLAGSFSGIPYLETQDGVVSRRRMPRVQIKFHTRVNPLLQGAHYISHQEFQCSLVDCLK